MWVMGSAPLLVSTDIRNLTALQRNVLLNNEVIAINQQPIAGDFWMDATVLPPPSPSLALAEDIAADGPPPLPPTGWFVAPNLDALPDLPVNTTPGSPTPFYEFGPTKDAEACQAACLAHAAGCNIFEWSGKSNNCWFRLDRKWSLRWAATRVSGCAKALVPGCGTSPTPPPGPAPAPPGPPRGCRPQIWTKPLTETAHSGTKGWGGLAHHSAVAVLNLCDTVVSVSIEVGLLGPGPMVVRDVWGNSTSPTSHTSSFSVPGVQPHETRLFRVWKTENNQTAA